ncbi:MAG: N-acetylneuraminate synthase family protein [Hyphomicrobiales bacterium]
MKNTYIIGEVGQNHNGEVEIAKKLIDFAAKPVVDQLFGESLKPLDAVKFTKRDLNEELSASEMNRPYDSPNSFGKTYGEHREYLELSNEEHFELYQYAKSKGLEVVETLCAIGCLSLLKLFVPDYLKVASRDLTNLPLLEAMAETKIPVILSTGMSGDKELEDAINTFSKYHSNITILHCLSQYPSEYKNINLRSMDWLKEHYPQYSIGYSDHSIGIAAPVAAVAMGAEMIEKHITLDRNMKGTDHKGSLGMDGLWRMVRDIRNIERALGEKAFYMDEAVKQTSVKLERSIASIRDLKAGELIGQEDIHMLSPGDGFKWRERASIIGKRLACDVSMNEIIYPNMIQDED